jgi:hypothetical protein
MPARLAAAGDLWREMDAARRSLRDPMAAIDGMLTEEDWQEAHAASTRRPVSRKAPKKRAPRPAR